MKKNIVEMTLDDFAKMLQKNNKQASVTLQDISRDIEEIKTNTPEDIITQRFKPSDNIYITLLCRVEPKKETEK
jgi:hypothetical protein